MTGLHGALAHFARTTPDAPALLGPGGGSYAQVWARVRAVAAQLQLLEGRVVALDLPEGPLLATVLTGALLSGALAFPLPASAPASERERLLAGLDVALRVGPDEAAALLDHPDADALAPTRFPAPEALVLLTASAGSTGAPARSAHRYAPLWHDALLHAERSALADGCRPLVVGSLSEALPLVSEVFAPWFVGGAASFQLPPSVDARGAEPAVAPLALPPAPLAAALSSPPSDQE